MDGEEVRGRGQPSPPWISAIRASARMSLASLLVISTSFRMLSVFSLVATKRSSTLCVSASCRSVRRSSRSSIVIGIFECTGIWRSGSVTTSKNCMRAIWDPCYIQSVAWEVEFTDEFEEWWHTLSESEQGKVDAHVSLLMERGPNLGFPFSSQVKTSLFPEMRELRAQAGGDDRWYEANVPVADRLFERHLRTIEKERAERG